MKVPENVQRSTATRLPLQWHPAFYAGLQIEFEKDAANLIYPYLLLPIWAKYSGNTIS